MKKITDLNSFHPKSEKQYRVIFKTELGTHTTTIYISSIIEDIGLASVLYIPKADKTTSIAWEVSNPQGIMLDGHNLPLDNDNYIEEL